MTDKKKLTIFFYDESKHEVISEHEKIKKLKGELLDYFNNLDSFIKFACISFTNESFCFRLADVKSFKVEEV